MRTFRVDGCGLQDRLRRQRHREIGKEDDVAIRLSDCFIEHRNLSAPLLMDDELHAHAVGNEMVDPVSQRSKLFSGDAVRDEDYVKLVSRILKPFHAVATVGSRLIKGRDRQDEANMREFVGRR